MCRLSVAGPRYDAEEADYMATYCCVCPLPPAGVFAASTAHCMLFPRMKQSGHKYGTFHSPMAAYNACTGYCALVFMPGHARACGKVMHELLISDNRHGPKRHQSSRVAKAKPWVPQPTSALAWPMPTRGSRVTRLPDYPLL